MNTTLFDILETTNKMHPKDETPGWLDLLRIVSAKNGVCLFTQNLKRKKGIFAGISRSYYIEEITIAG